MARSQPSTHLFDQPLRGHPQQLDIFDLGKQLEFLLKELRCSKPFLWIRQVAIGTIQLCQQIRPKPARQPAAGQPAQIGERFAAYAANDFKMGLG